jgi:hypothetical protein
MYSQGDIEDAVAAGALAPDQAVNLRNYVATRNGAPTADEEYFRFFLGFNDLFVAYACFFALVAVGWLGTLAPIDGGGATPPMPLLAGLLVAAGSWGLSELFSRRRRFALPSILLNLTFAFGVFATLAMLVALMVGARPEPTTAGVLLAVCAGLTAAAAWLYWRRFRMPIGVMVYVMFGIAALVILIASMLARSSGMNTVLSAMLLLTGIGAFVYAMYWDGRDPRRFGTSNEVGLWLHWLAASLIAYGLTGLFGWTNGVDSAGGAIGMVVIYLLFAVVALIVNRRALLIAGLAPLITAISSLTQGRRGSSRYDDDFDRLSYGGGSDRFGDVGSGMGSGYGRSSGADAMFGTMSTILIISIILLLLAIFWRPLRRALLGILPAGLRARVPAADQMLPGDTTHV